MVRMPLQDCQRTVNLLQQDNASQFMCQRHPAQGDYVLGSIETSFAEPVGWPHPKHQWQRILFLMVSYKTRELF